jgi:hypothetical protein
MSTADKVKRYMTFAMRIKTSGAIDKFQIVNRKREPFLQTGMRNKSNADYQGVVEEKDQIEQTGGGEMMDHGPQWERRGRR